MEAKTESNELKNIGTMSDKGDSSRLSLPVGGGESSTNQIVPNSSTSSLPPTNPAADLVPGAGQHRRIFKIIVIGDSNVGKTCLTYRFCGGKFLDRSEATIGVDFREKTVQIDDELIKLQIWDTGFAFFFGF